MTTDARIPAPILGDTTAGRIVDALRVAGRLSRHAVARTVARSDRWTRQELRRLIDAGLVALDPCRGNESRIYRLADAR